MDWPGWEKDEELAARHAKELRRQLQQSVDPHELIAAWDLTYVIPSRWQDNDAEEFLYANGQSGKIQGVLSDVLDILWREAWELGVTSAMQIAGDTSQAALVKGGKKDTWKCDLGHKHDTPGAAGMLIRHKAPGEKRRYLLHKRTDDGTWVNFGGGLHPGESPWDGAKREVTEEAGKLPANLKYRHTIIDDHGGWQHHMFVMDAPEQFNPSMDGETPDEVAGAAWFTKKEIRDLPLFHALRETWDTVRQAKDDTAINAAMHKGWRNPFSWAKPAPLPDDPWQDIRDQLQDAGVSAEVSGPLSSSYLTWESYQGATGIIGMVATLVGKLADVLLRRRRGQLTAPEAEHVIDDILSDESHSLRIAATEAAKAINNAAAEAYIVTNNIEWVRWVTAHDSKVCGECRANAAAGPVPIDRPFPSGSMMPPEHPYCILGSSRVLSLSPIDAVSERDYTGEVVILRTALGYELTVTPNHPVATPDGWVAAELLKSGDDVLSSTEAKWELLRRGEDVNNVPPRIEEIAQSFSMIELAKVPVAAEDFHGDGTGSKICVIWADRFLMNSGVTEMVKHLRKLKFTRRDVPVDDLAFASASVIAELFGGSLTPAYSGISARSELLSLLETALSHPDMHRLTSSSGYDSQFQKTAAYYVPADVEGFCKRLLASSCDITTDKLVGADRKYMTTHVYNLDTEDGWYIANGIVSHNCRCVIVPAEPAPRTRHEEMINPLDWMPYESHKSAETPFLASHHAPIGHEGLWHSKHPPLQLPAYIQQIRNALMRNGMGEREAHAMAVAAVERWAKGRLEWGPHRHVTPEVRAASADAVSQWEALRAHHP
jgi:8-oxo-dGTP pyrophosphatase MutT (NUDIX family)